MTVFFPWKTYLELEQIREIILLLLMTAIFGSTVGFVCQYRKTEKQLKTVIKIIEIDGNRIEAWKKLQNIKVSMLAPWQKKIYDKKRLYLRVVLGNMCGAAQELERFQDDKAFYHFMKAIMFSFKGNYRNELVEEKLAEDYCDGDTDPSLHFQIIANRGVGYVAAGEYSLANDCFERAITFGCENNLLSQKLLLTIYYNYIFNKTRIQPDISIEDCLELLENVKKFIDIEDPKQYIGYSNIVIEILRQKNADRTQINDIINGDFNYLIHTKLTNKERCVLEATTARIVCTGRLDPSAVIERMSKDISLFLQLPMPERYKCFKEIDYLFKDLRGTIVEKNHVIKEIAHEYIVSRAVKDLDEYRADLPAEAIHEICYCLIEKAGLWKYNTEQYSWNGFLKDIRSVQMLYKENELLVDAALCNLHIMDEALAEFNMDVRFTPLHLEVMNSSLQEIEEILPEFMEHPVLNEIYLRLSDYCLAMGNVQKSQLYYEKMRKLSNYSIDHFAPWLRKRYFIISLYMLVLGYIETVDKIAQRNLNQETPLVREWFEKFHERNGYLETLVFCKILGKERFPMYLRFIPEMVRQDMELNVRDIASAWLVIPELSVKIKCNGSAYGQVYGPEALFSVCVNAEIRCGDASGLRADAQIAVERVIEMLTAEMPKYLASSEELESFGLSLMS